MKALGVAVLAINAIYGLLALAFLACAATLGWVIFFS
jgi:hypothetical protein